MIGIKRTNNAYELAAWYTAADVFVTPTLEAAELKGRLEMVSVKDKRFVGGSIWHCLAKCYYKMRDHLPLR